jgi:transposase
VVTPPSDDASREDLRALVMKLIEVTNAQAREIEELKAKLKKDSGNSSKPPSSDAPWSKRRRQRKPASGKKQGGQPGHEGASRQSFDASAVHHVEDHRAAACPSCGSGELEAIDRAPVRHQVIDVPILPAQVTEHRRHRSRCASCGEEILAPLPVTVPRSSFGPRLSALAAQLSGVFRLSRRETARFCKDAFGVEMSLGSVAAIERRMAAALAPAHEQALTAARAAPVLHIDETPWKLRGALRWLWTATTEGVTAFRVDERRSFEALKRLIGEAYAGRVVSDRMGAYDKLPLERRQICWAHLDRDMRALAEGHPGERAFGKTALVITKAIFRSWRAFLEHGDRERLRAELLPSWEKLLTHLADGAASPEPRVAALSSHLLDRAEALWSFADHPGVDPTNNAAERSVRKAVLWRKGSFGSQSESGCRFVERILTVTATLRQQGRSVLDFLVAVASAPLNGVPPPALVPAPALPG